jgi:hypothetical protein
VSARDRASRTAAVVLAGVLSAACRTDPEGAPKAGVELGPVRELPTPAGAGSGQPNLSSADGTAYLSWVEPAAAGAHALRFSTRAAGGGWSEPRTVAQGSGWFVNWADFPGVAAVAGGTLAAHWLVKTGPAAYAYEVRLAFSSDRGATWGRPVVPHRDGTATEHGFVSLVPWHDGRLGVVWLDGRNMAAHEGHGGGATALMYAAVGADGGQAPEATVDPRVCDCCQTAAARTDEGVLVAYRDRSESEVRDIATVRYVEGRWSQPVTLGNDRWQINGCPVNGPAVAAADARVAVAWFSAPAEPGRVQLAFSADSGRTFGAPVRLDEGRPLGRVDVALLGHDTAVVSWLEQVDGGAEVRIRTVPVDGAPGPPLTVARTSEARSSGFPRLERAGGEVIVAWRDDAEPARVRTAIVEVRR